MHALTQCCALLLLMHLLTVGQCADCTLKDFKQSRLFDENFELANLEQSYSSGSSVRVRCKVGYNGFFRMVCSNGKWIPHGDKCRPMSCGHPGDAPFADFRLVSGSDYVFGSQVLYTCHKGYQMTTLTDTRNCLQGGWDGRLPECEPISCSSISVSDNVLVYGDLEQPTSGSVLQFSCRSRGDELVGAAQIFCDENGKWSHNPPMCREISCEKPESDNIEVAGDKMTYKEGEVLRYSCKHGYRKVDGRPSVCRKQGLSAQWTPMPLCELITCKLSSNPPEGTTYNPQNQIIFKPGQRVRVSCGEKQWVKSKEFQSAELTCQDTGRWDIDPVCQLVTCSKIAENVNRWDWTRFNTIEIDQTLWYDCHGGYVKTSSRARCTRRGWEPDPLCKVQPCMLQTPPQGTTYDPQNQLSFDPGQRVRVSCGEKQWVKNKELQSAELTCQKRGRWNFDPVCQQVTCSKTVEKVYSWEHTWSNTVEMDKMLWYRCYDDYVETSPRAKCTRRGWEPDPLCKDKTCIQPSYKNADITDMYPKEEYRQDERVNFKCTYDPATSFSVLCHSGTWYYDRPCKEKPCTTQPVIKKGETYLRPRETYDHGDQVLFRCIGETETFRVTCQAGEWNAEKSCEDVACTEPPVIKNAEMVSERERTYPHGQTVEFRCTTGQRELFTVSCQSGKWKNMHQCPEQSACVGTDIPNGFSHLSNNKLYYTCSEGYRLLTKGWWGEASCVGGKWKLQECVASTDCGPVPDIPNLIVSSESKSFSEGDTFPIQCEAGHQNLNPNLRRLICKKGTWNSKGVEFKQICTPITNKCPPPPEVKNAVVMAPFENEYSSNTRLTYKCRDHFIMEGDGTVQCNNGTWEQKDISCKAEACTEPPVITNAEMFRERESTDPLGQSVEFRCTTGQRDSFTVTCQSGKWNYTHQCPAEACTEPPVITNAEMFRERESTDPLGQSVEFRCTTGQREHFTVTCQSGKWNYTHQCPAAPQPQ